MNAKKGKIVTSDEVWAQMAETDAKLQAMFAASDKRLAKLEKIVKDVCKETGGLSKNAGLHAEQFFQDSLRKTKNFGGQKYDRIIPNLKCGNGKVEGEFDIVLVNGKSIAIIEVKSRVRLKHLNELIKEKLKRFRKLFPEYKTHTAYLGVAGFSFDKDMLDKAKELGIGIIKQVGKSIELDDKKLKAY